MILAFDPGKSGGWAVLSLAGHLVGAGKLRYRDDLLDIDALRDDVIQWMPPEDSRAAVAQDVSPGDCVRMAAVEGQRWFGQGDAKHGPSVVKLIRVEGMLLGFCMAHRLLTVSPMPREWRGGVGLQAGQKKNASVDLANGLFGWGFTATQDGIAEAALIAEHCRRHVWPRVRGVL